MPAFEHGEPMGATATYKGGRWARVEAGDGLSDFRLTVTARRGVAGWCKVERDEYGVQEEDNPFREPGRSFLLVNETDPGQPDAYRTFMADRGPDFDHCTCDAGKVGRHRCKHKDALRIVLAKVPAPRLAAAV